MLNDALHSDGGLSGIWRLLLGLLLAALMGGQAMAANPNKKLCFTRTGTPTINGLLDDTAWGNGAWQSGSWKYVAGNGTSLPDGIAQGTRDANNLYFAFQVNNDATIDATDVVVLTLDAGPGGPRKRFHLYHSCIPGGCPGGVVHQAKVWTWNAGTANWEGLEENPPWLGIDAHVVYAGTSSSWSLEVKIPLAEMPVPASGLFGMYFNMVRIDSGSNTARQLDWPPEVTDISGATASEVSFFLETGTPPEANWGNGTRGGVSCSGVYFGTMDIATNQNPTSLISRTPGTANTFSVTVHNSSINSMGSSVEAPGVRAKFSLANWGIPGTSEWSQVPAANNRPVGTVPAAGQNTLTTGAWVLSGTEIANYAPPRNHQCVRVDLDVDPAAVLPGNSVEFLNHIAYRNMDFEETSSPVKREAHIGVKGFKLPDNAERHELILREHTFNTPVDSRWISQIDGLTPVGDQPGLYTLKLGPEETRRVYTAVTPPKIKIPKEMIAIPPGSGGTLPLFQRPSGVKPVAVTVRAGDVVTLIADGAVQRKTEGVSPLPDGPLGGVALTRMTARTATLNLPKTLVREAPLGALVGSFDGFETSFLIGDAKTVRVPKGATQLLLAINDADGAFAAQSGKGFSVQVTQTPARTEYRGVAKAVPSTGNALAVALPLGANLPTWMMCGEYKTGRKLNVDGNVYDVVAEAGCFGYMVKAINDGGGGNGGICNTFSNRATAGLGVGVMLAGLTLRRRRRSGSRR